MEIICKFCKSIFIKSDSYVKSTKKYYGENGASFCSIRCGCEYRKSLHWEKRTCANCGKEFMFKISTSKNRNNTGQFCSKKCRTNSGRITKTCEKCGKKYETLLFYKNIKKYCSTECANNRRGKKFPVVCVICGKIFYDIPSKIEKRKCCSLECRGKYTSAILKKHSEDNKRRCSYPSWKKIRKIVIDRDGGKCTRCGAESNLVVHHIVAWKKVREDNVDNLITFCRKCHTIIEPRFKYSKKI